MERINNNLTSLDQLLKIYKADIINSTAKRLTYFHLPHYKSYGFKNNNRNVAILFDYILKSCEKQNVGETVKYARDLAKVHFGSDYNPFEKQAAFNIIEENIWQLIIDKLPPVSHSYSIRLVTTIVGIAKDSIANFYEIYTCEKYNFKIDTQALINGLECM